MGIPTNPICQKCGCEINKEGSFCGKCGNNIKVYSFYDDDYRITLDNENIVFEQKVFSKTMSKKLKINNILEIQNIPGWSGTNNIKIVRKDGIEEKWQIVLNKYDETNGTFNEFFQYIKNLIDKNPKEIRKKCHVCGKIFCYNANDIKDNNSNVKLTAMASLGSMASTIVGTRYDAYEQSKIASNSMDKIIDFDKCPNCGSTNLEDISNTDLTTSLDQNNKFSAADEIKKYKELLDCGAITQEEFDSKKKELLNL